MWRQIIGDSPQGASLLHMDATAQRVMEAWRLLHQHRLPIDGRYAATQDWEAFASWAREFEALCSRRRWIDPARLVNAMLDRIRAGDIALPETSWYAGFDELAPQRREFLSAIGARSFEPQPRRSITRTRACSTAEHEIRCAAAWSRDVLERDPSARIGIVIFNLAQLRSKVERIFRDELEPGARPTAPSAIHISLGRRFDEYPLIHAALLLLEFAAGGLTLPHVGLLLRSPFLKGASQERDARALLDVRLRRLRIWRVSAQELQAHVSGECRLLRHLLKTFLEIMAGVPETALHAVWSRTFSDLLHAIGWPSDRPLDSREHQLMARWSELLSQFAALDVVSAPLSMEDAVHRLRSRAAGVIFQFEDAGAPVQISDAAESAGLHFDHAWIMGLHDEALPAPAAPNPFLPASLQREHRVPDASPEQHFEAARILFQRLNSCAEDVVLSFPQMEGDRALEPSPFLTAPPLEVSAPANAWIGRIRSAVNIETFFDEAGPPVPDESVQRGGARVLADMAACPFRAFAVHRLGARELDDMDPGLSASDKGRVLHEVLQLVWDELRSYDALRRLEPDSLDELLQRSIHAVLNRYPENTNTAVERLRLQRLLTQWMNLERARQPFTIARLEEKREIEIGRMRLDVRADRIDELPDGRWIILDYKSGDVRPNGWTGDRLDEPQLPLYCVSSEAKLAGAVFARIQAEGVGFTGVAEHPLPGFTSYVGNNPPALAVQMEEWRTALTNLAERFQSGDARVDPKKKHKTCEYCAVMPLCRIRERRYENNEAPHE